MNATKTLNSWLVGMQNNTVYSLAVSYKVKYILTVQSANHAPRYLHKWNELETYVHKNSLHMNVYNSLIHNHSKLAATKMFFNR